MSTDEILLGELEHKCAIQDHQIRMLSEQIKMMRDEFEMRLNIYRNQMESLHNTLFNCLLK